MHCASSGFSAPRRGLGVGFGFEDFGVVLRNAIRPSSPKALYHWLGRGECIGQNHLYQGPIGPFRAGAVGGDIAGPLLPSHRNAGQGP